MSVPPPKGSTHVQTYIEITIILMFAFEVELIDRETVRRLLVHHKSSIDDIIRASSGYLQMLADDKCSATGVLWETTQR